MINLVKNEIYKLLHKKSTYIILFIAFVYMLFVNAVYSDVASVEVSISYSNTYYSKDELTTLIEEFDVTKESVDVLIGYETELELNTLFNKYTKDDWQYYVIYDYLYVAVYNYYEALYYGYEDSSAVDTYNEYINALDSDNWEFYAKIDIDNAKYELEGVNQILKTDLQESDKTDYLIQKEYIETILKAYEYRLDKEIIFGDDYLNDAIDAIRDYGYEVIESNYIKTDDENLSSFKEHYYTAWYELENKVDVTSYDTSRMVLINFFSEYYIIILLFIIMIAGSIVSDEFSNGTIKSLLVTPSSRIKIILSKFITVIIMLLMFIIVLVLFQLILGIIMLDVDSLSIPALVYNDTTGELMEISLFKYLLTCTIGYLPKIIITLTLAFMLSTVTSSTSASIAITFCFSLMASIINSFAYLDIKFFDYFITTNWDLYEFLYGGISSYGYTLTHSSIICIIYFLIMLIITIVVFKKKDIKNI